MMDLGVMHTQLGRMYIELRVAWQDLGIARSVEEAIRAAEVQASCRAQSTLTILTMALTILSMAPLTMALCMKALAAADIAILEVAYAILEVEYAV